MLKESLEQLWETTRPHPAVRSGASGTHARSEIETHSSRRRPAAGPRLRGAVLPGGGDWVSVRKDGVSELDVRITLKCDDGSLIFVSYRGVADIPPDVRARIAK